eukprot:748189-Hanusia_phi.AAC.3
MIWMLPGITLCLLHSSSVAQIGFPATGLMLLSKERAAVEEMDLMNSAPFRLASANPSGSACITLLISSAPPRRQSAGEGLAVYAGRGGRENERRVKTRAGWELVIACAGMFLGGIKRKGTALARRTEHRSGQSQGGERRRMMWT